MTLEEWIMLAEIVAGVIAIGTIGAFLANMYSTNKKVKETEEKLSNEHTAIKQGISNENAAITKQQDRIEQHVSYLYGEYLLKKETNNKLSNKMLDICQTIEHINALVESVSNLKNENNRLMQECQTLTQERESLLEERAELQQYIEELEERVNFNEMDREDEFEL